MVAHRSSAEDTAQTHWMRPPDGQDKRLREALDPRVEGARYGWSATEAWAIWEHVCLEIAGAGGSDAVDRARQRFHEAGVRAVAGGGEPGKRTRVGVELGVAAAAPAPARIAVPGRDTLVAVEARRRRVIRHAVYRDSVDRDHADDDQLDHPAVAAALTRGDAGAPLPGRTRLEMEGHLGIGLAGVRVHTDAEAAAACAALGARAFTAGDHIYFAAGAFAPDALDGRRLLAHELTHVVQAYQQRTGSEPRVSRPDEPLEREADQVAASVAASPPSHEAAPASHERSSRVAAPASRAAFPARLPARPLTPPGLARRGAVMRSVMPLRSGASVTDVSPGTTDNLRDDVLLLLDRLHVLWATSTGATDVYAEQTAYIRRLAPAAQVPQRDPSPPAAAVAAGASSPWSFRPTLDSIDRAREPKLAGPVIDHFLAITVTGGVGRGLANVREDVIQVMDRLNFLRCYTGGYATEKAAAQALAPGAAVPDAGLTASFAAITQLKTRIAAGASFAAPPGSAAPPHADEREHDGDRFGAQTSIVDGDPMPNVRMSGSPAPVTFPKQLAVFVPRGLTAQNKVHAFFTPFLQPIGFLTQQGLRAQEDGSPWILIGVPALGETDSPNRVTLSTAEIERCLTALGRPTAIHALRLTAHSRGHRGLEASLGGRHGTPTLPLGLVERVTVFDASYGALGDTLRAREAALTGMHDPATHRFAAGAIQLYDVTVSNISRFTGTRLAVSGIRALAYVRMVQEGLARRQITTADLATLPTATATATRALLALPLPARGSFTTHTPPPTGMTDLAGWLRGNDANLTIVDHASNGLKPFITAHALDGGAGFDRSIDAHHWFVGELAHEAVE